MSPAEHIADLWSEVSSLPETSWRRLLVTAISQNPATYDYLCKISIETAMIEAGATPDLVSRMCKNLEELRVLPRALRIRANAEIQP